MNPGLNHAMERLRANLKSLSGRSDWQTATYALQSVPYADDWKLTRLNPERADGERLEQRSGDASKNADAITDFVAHAAYVVRTTVVGDVASIVAALNDPVAPGRYGALGLNVSATPAPTFASVLAVPCVDPWHSHAANWIMTRAVGVLTVAGGMPPSQVVENADLRYFVEEYAKSVSSLLNTNEHLGYWSTKFMYSHPERSVLPDIQIVNPKTNPAAVHIGEVKVFEDHSSPFRPKYVWLEGLPEANIRITSYSNNFEPFRVQGEKWFQFGPGLAAPKADIESFATGLAKLRANEAYVNELEKKPY